MPSLVDAAYQNMTAYYGDIHNHCGLSYGSGTLDDALQNARLQLDFASVTIHAVWPDLPTDDPHLNYLVDYHHEGFMKARANWPEYLKQIEAANESGRFVTFPSFEWHSNEYGDYCVYYKAGGDCPIIEADDLPSLRDALRTLPTSTMMIPHHIGYKRGSRGINWEAFTGDLTPVVEIFSFHGLSDSSEGPYPYYHSMGPRHEKSTAQYGWRAGHIFGVIGSSDHHNASPGSYGYGRLAVWAEDLSRESIWQAIQARRTYAITGDRIRLAFSLNGAPMGSIVPNDDQRVIDVAISGGSALDYVDVLHNNRLIHRETIYPSPIEAGVFKVYIELGWGERDDDYPWDVDLEVYEGEIQEISPRFRGLGPTDVPRPGEDFAYHTITHTRANHVRLHTKTRKNPSLHTASTEGIALTIAGDSNTRIAATINGQQYELHLADLFTGARTFYTGGFVSPAVCFHRAVPMTEFAHRFTFTHQQQSTQRDWYTVRVRQHNDQWAWSSPIWVEGSPS